jgi:hypothetical protein
MNKVEDIIPILENWLSKTSFTQGALVPDATNLLKSLISGTPQANYGVSIHYDDIADKNTQISLLYLKDCLKKYSDVAVFDDCINNRFVVLFK